MTLIISIILLNKKEGLKIFIQLFSGEFCTGFNLYFTRITISSTKTCLLQENLQWNFDNTLLLLVCLSAYKFFFIQNN